MSQAFIDTIDNGAVGDLLNGIIARFDKFMTRMVNEGGLVDMAKGAMDAVGSRVSAVAQSAGDGFSAFSEKSTAPDAPMLARSKQQEVEVAPTNLPQEAIAAVHNMNMKSENIKPTVVEMDAGAAVSPTAVAFGGQQQSMGIGMA